MRADSIRARSCGNDGREEGCVGMVAGKGREKREKREKKRGGVFF